MSSTDGGESETPPEAPPMDFRLRHALVTCVFGAHTWLGYYPLAPGYWQKSWVLSVGGFGCTKTFGIGTIGGSDTGYEHLGYSCY